MLLHAIVKGNVQGVGFRYTTKQLADRLHLNGSVCNLPNGDVEIYAQGPKKDLEALLHQLKKNFDISDIIVAYSSPEREFSGFHITRI